QIKSMSNPFFQVDNENMDISDLSAIFTTQYQTHEVIIIEVESCKIGPRPEGMPRYWPILYKDKYLWNFINVSGKQALKEQGILNYNERQLFVDDFHDSIKIHGKSIWLYMFSNLDHLYRESLPALYLIKQVYGSLDGFNIVTPHISEDLVILLEGLGVKRNKIIQVGNTWIEFDNVIITSFPSFGHLHTPSDYYIKSCNNLSESFSKLSNITQKHKIFISRRNATQRKIHNEIDL
ncbi:TPA: glycosyltransferase family 61 protein, partial [Escherichia coli]|nr:glycosyltransferase family 61 protein [Escherichia coli]